MIARRLGYLILFITGLMVFECQSVVGYAYRDKNASLPVAVMQSIIGGGCSCVESEGRCYSQNANAGCTGCHKVIDWIIISPGGVIEQYHCECYYLSGCTSAPKNHTCSGGYTPDTCSEQSNRFCCQRLVKCKPRSLSGSNMCGAAIGGVLVDVFCQGECENEYENIYTRTLCTEE